MEIQAAFAEATTILEIVTRSGFNFADAHLKHLSQAIARGISVRVLFFEVETAISVYPDSRERSVRGERAFREAGCDVQLAMVEPSRTCVIVDRRVALVGSSSLSRGFDVLVDERELKQVISYFDRAWYAPRQVIYEDIFAVAAPNDAPMVATVADVTWTDLIGHLAANPQKMYELSPRRFEEMVAELLLRENFDVTLTPPARDGGRDILAVTKDSIGRHLYYVECKRYAPTHLVGVEIVRAVYGVLEKARATGAMIVTSSRFTRGAIRETCEVENRMALKDYEALQEWLRRHALTTQLSPGTPPANAC